MTSRATVSISHAVTATLALVGWLCASDSAHAQLTHRGATGLGVITQTVQYTDTWERGGTALSAGPRDILSRVETRQGEGRDVTVNLVLYGPWGSHLYAFNESARTTDGPRTTLRSTTWRAVDLNADGRKELVFIERSASVMTLLPTDGDFTKDTGPFFDSLTCHVRWLERTDAALVEHDFDGDPDSEIFTILASHEFGGAVNSALQLMAGDFLFNAAQFEKARYRYQVAREWAESALPGRDVANLSLDMPLLQVDPDEPAFTWIQAARRFGSLPAWFKR